MGFFDGIFLNENDDIQECIASGFLNKHNKLLYKANIKDIIYLDSLDQLEEDKCIHFMTPKQDYINMLLKAKKHIENGDIYQINLAMKFDLCTTLVLVLPTIQMRKENTLKIF